ncbi:MAG: glucosaminidase domain-containing protein [Patescibacteria group bacterium]
MNKHKITRFLQSVVAIPMLAITTPMLGVTAIPSPTVVLSQNAVESQVITTPEDKIRKERADAIDKFFASRGAPLEGYGMKFVEEAEEHDIDWRLLAAISIIESNGGKQACKKADNSVLGYGSCKMSFKSIDESIELVSMKISGNNSNYYHDQMTTPQILRKYNSVIPTYVQKVTKVMKMIDPSEEIV